MKAAVVIDAWKLDVFKKHLDKAGFEYTEGPGPAPETMALFVICDSAATILPIVQAATDEAARTKLH